MAGVAIRVFSAGSAVANCRNKYRNKIELSGPPKCRATCGFVSGQRTTVAGQESISPARICWAEFCDWQATCTRAG